MKSRMNGGHLTDAEFTDLLLGSMAPAVSEHLEACAACAEEARRVSGAIGTFEAETRLWAERHAATMPALVVPSQLDWVRRPAAITTWAAMTAALVLWASLGVRHLQQPAQAPVAVASTEDSAAPLSDATLKADNDLLAAIDGQLQASAAPPASLYGLDNTMRRPHGPGSKRIAPE